MEKHFSQIYRKRRSRSKTTEMYLSYFFCPLINKDNPTSNYLEFISMLSHTDPLSHSFDVFRQFDNFIKFLISLSNET